MNLDEIKKQILFVIQAVEQLEKCIVLSYITHENSERNQQEWLDFIEVCRPFDKFAKERPMKPTALKMATALDVVVKANECVKNDTVFGSIERTMLEFSTDVITKSVQAIAIALDHK